MKEDKLLRINQIIPDILPISKTSWWNGVKSGLYPQPIKLGPRTTAWRESDVMKIVSQGVKYDKEAV
jgi:predicted DNA-binding transcriptional regulator AlpA